MTAALVFVVFLLGLLFGFIIGFLVCVSTFPGAIAHCCLKQEPIPYEGAVYYVVKQ
jgi:uncharacterized protein YneF (UPF0154 family)